jgi:hypothetical protein
VRVGHVCVAILNIVKAKLSTVKAVAATGIVQHRHSQLAQGTSCKAPDSELAIISTLNVGSRDSLKPSYNL